MTQEVTQETIDQLEKQIPALKDGDASFATSLVSQWDRKGWLSVKQQEWIFILLERAEGAATGSMAPRKKLYDSTDIGAVGPIFELFRKAQKRGTTLTLRIMVDGRQLKLTQMAEGKPININEYPIQGKIWHGALEPTGKLSLTEKCKIPELLTQTLKELAENPSQASGKIGKRMRACCFCGISLSTTDSLFYGYGPICAENYGLEWGNARSHIKKELMGDAVKEMQNVKLF